MQRCLGHCLQALFLTLGGRRFHRPQADEQVLIVTAPLDVEDVAGLDSGNDQTPFRICARYHHGGIIPLTTQYRQPAARLLLLSERQEERDAILAADGA